MIRTRPKARQSATLAAALLAGLAAVPATADEALLEAACGTCHETTDAGMSRISGQRKTPEGWLMTMVRMRQVHQAEFDVATQARLVAYLSETQGMAPSETAPWRYALEKDPDWIEANEEPLGSMCSRCHTSARFHLQARTPAEWQMLIDFHVGQYPTIEYQALGRDRYWYEIASDEIAALLADAQPLETQAWTDWQAAGKPAVAGDWVMLAEIPGKGRAGGRVTVEGDASPFLVSGSLALADGTALPVSGNVNLYTGYEWRGAVTVGDMAMRQVFALGTDGTLSGRMFLRDQDSLGGAVKGVRADAGATILGTVPEAVSDLSGDAMVIGASLDELKVSGALAFVSADPAGAAVSFIAGKPGLATLSAGEATGSVALYTVPDRITVEPAFTIARVGGGDAGAPPPVPASFSAIGWWNGPDGTPETEDDIRIGEVAAEWSFGNANETAKAMQDAAFAGELGADGIFLPAIAGPNPARKYQTNNAGELTVTATAGDLTATGALVVTVQRFIDPPIR